jgi:hypothetical protein
MERHRHLTQTVCGDVTIVPRSASNTNTRHANADHIGHVLRVMQQHQQRVVHPSQIWPAGWVAIEELRLEVGQWHGLVPWIPGKSAHPCLANAPPRLVRFSL